MEGGINILVVFLLLGYVQCNVISRKGDHAIIEDLRASSGSRIVGGWPAYDGQFPFKVSLRTIRDGGGVSACGAALIHHHWVITAAHCLANRITFVVRIGLTDLSRPEIILESQDTHIHPDYDVVSAGVQTADIALLGLDHFVPYGPFVQPCRLQSSEQKNTNYEGVVLSVSGYGRIDDWWNGGVLSDVLLWTHLRGITNEECLRWYPNSQVIQAETVCAEYYNDTSQSTCTGDSGGPLTVVDEDGKTTMIGIVSFGHFSGCNGPHPAGYVRPGHYHDWIEEVTGINFDWTAADLKFKPIKLDLSEDKVMVDQ